MGTDIIDNTFFEVQAEKFYQKKVEVARGVIELGQILIETKEKLPHGSWIKWLEDSRVNFSRRQSSKYMKIASELGNGNYQFPFDQLSLNKLYTLASAPEEVKEELGTTNSRVFDSVSINKCILPRYIRPIITKKIIHSSVGAEEVKEEY